MGCIDEVGDRVRFTSWSFVDFLEGLARLAEALALPTAYELGLAAEVYEGTLKPGQSSGFDGKFWQWRYLNQMGTQYLKENRRPSFGVVRSEFNASERPLANKMEALLNLMIAGLCEVWNVGRVDEAAVVKKLLHKTRASRTTVSTKSLKSLKS